MKYKRKKIVTGAVAVMLIAVTILLQMMTAMAAEADYQAVEGVVNCGEGDAVIVIDGNSGQSLKGKQFQLHALFTAENSMNYESINYILNPTYKTVLQTVVGEELGKSEELVSEYEIIDYMVSLNSGYLDIDLGTPAPEPRDGDYRYFIEAVAEEIENAGIAGSVIDIQETKSDNTVKLTGLSYGYYMLKDVSETVGEHAALSMPIVSTTAPMTVVYLKSDYPTIVQKIQEDSDGSWSDVADYEFGQNVPYRYQSSIPEINGYASYYYAWHTKHDPALTPQIETIQIVMKGWDAGVEKTYVLEPDEYIVIQDTGDHTFTVEVTDMKAIVDREFVTLKDNTENTYGQEVTLTYQSILNDKARMDTGRPGYENDVQLEFSNNPYVSGASETGFTSWDTVVCFSYVVIGQKTNNYGLELEGAKFRLYRDAECEEEILIKNISGSYLVMNPDSMDEERELLATEMISDEDGLLRILGLDADTYYLKETEAPSGYRPLTAPIRIEMKAEFSGDRDNYVKGDGEGELLTLSAIAIMKSFVDGQEKEQNLELQVDQLGGIAYLTIVNQVGRMLPVTGTTAILMMGAAGVTLIVIATLRGKRKHE